MRDENNRRVKDCGCQYVRYAAAGLHPEGWVRVGTCDEHRDKS